NKQHETHPEIQRFSAFADCLVIERNIIES
ncbi:MAG: hypothetical protein ACI9PZ_003278, partial [Parvicella sp.]